MIIRKAKLKDVPAIAKLGVELIKYHHKFDPYEAPSKDIYEVYFSYFKKCLYSSKKLLLAAADNNKVVGYSLSSLSSRPPVFKLRKIGYIDDMFLDKDHRKSGGAQQFFDEIFPWFKSKGIKNVEITVHVKNNIGKKAWAKYGFREYITRLTAKI